jgi:hypothetical protein
LESKIEVLSTVKVERTNDLYKIVTTLNKTLKYQDLMFGLAIDEKDANQMVFTIYKT